jgi:hypothetical protein
MVDPGGATLEIKMLRRMLTAAAISVAIGCSRKPTEAVIEAPSVVTFAGQWRSVTPPVEFIRLSVVSKSSDMGALGLRLTLSGLAWEGSGRISGDSLVANMMVAGTTQPIGTIVVRARDAGTLRVQMRPAAAQATDLTLVRED